MDIKKSDIDDTKLLEAMHAYIREPGKETLFGLVMALKDSKVFVPVMINQQKKALQPYVIKNKDEDVYVPAFTSVSKFPEDQQYQGMQKLQYKQCVSMLLGNEASIKGIVLNPYTDNLMLKEQMLELSSQVEKEVPTRRSVTMKTEDFRMITRHNTELRQIPERFYAGRQEFIKELSAELLCEMYKEPYSGVDQEALFEYVAEDFDIMELDIRDDLNIVQIMLPSRHLYKTNCREMYLVWNPQNEHAGCYVVEKDTSPDGKRYLLKEIRPDGSWDSLEDAPAEGNIMNRVIELFTDGMEE